MGARRGARGLGRRAVSAPLRVVVTREAGRNEELRRWMPEGAEAREIAEFRGPF